MSPTPNSLAHPAPFATTRWVGEITHGDALLLPSNRLVSSFNGGCRVARGVLTTESQTRRADEPVQSNTMGILHAHPFLDGMAAGLIGGLEDCAAPCSFRRGEYLWSQGQPADRLYLIATGTVSLEIHVPHVGPQHIDTVRAGDALGFPWLEVSYRWKFDARATTDVQAIGLDGGCVRERMEANAELGYQLLRRYLPVLWRRLEAARLQLLHLEATGK